VRRARRRAAGGPARAVLARALLSTLLLGSSPGLLQAHPIHTTLSEISTVTGGAVRVLVRTFADDFSTAVSRFTRTPARADHAVTDAAAGRYVAAAFTLTDARGRPLPLTLVAQRRTGDVVWLELTANVASLAGTRVRNAMLFDVHPDQVNIVKATYGGTTGYTTLFSRGDAAKALP
jgi:hypothetical protein